MSKRNNFKSQASSSRATIGQGFGGFGATAASNPLSYLAEPANLSNITDPNVIVSFKNLSKKDGTTKTKGLDDLRAYTEAHPFNVDGGVEDPILEAWVNHYPRLSIDNSRRVRELSHIVLCDLLKSARKRMEKHIPKIAGAWLAGLYDKDRAVAKAANTSLTSFLDTDAKVVFLKRQCQTAILVYVQDALSETPETLSDERTMSEDDRKDKYHRVMSSSLYLISSLLSTLGVDDISKNQDKYESLLSKNETVWSLAASQDTYVRKAVHELLVACVDHQPRMIEESLKIVGQSLIVDSLHISQSTTASSLLYVYASLSSKFPQVWTLPHKGEDIPSLLQDFISKGPTGCSNQYWHLLLDFLKKLPDQILTPDLKGSKFTLTSLAAGIESKTTPAAHLDVAWDCYAQIASLIVSRLPDIQSSIRLCEACVYPLFKIQVLQKTTGPTSRSEDIAKSMAKIYNISASLDGEEASVSNTKAWEDIATSLTNSIKTTLPEQSRTYKESQDSTTLKGISWFRSVAAIVHLCDERQSEFILAPSRKVLLSCLSTLTSRNGKPYSAAAILETGIRLVPSLAQSTDVQSDIDNFLKTWFGEILTTPSAEYVVSMFYHLGDIRSDRDHLRDLWEDAVDGILAVQDAGAKTKAVQSLFTAKASTSTAEATIKTNDSFISFIGNTARCHDPLQKFLLEQINKFMNGATDLLTLFQQALLFNAMVSTSEARMVELASSNFANPHFGVVPQFGRAFDLLELLFRTKPILLKSDEIRALLVVKLFCLTELPSHDNAREASLKNIIDTLSSGEGSEGSREKAIVRAIRYALHTQCALSPDTLIKHARGLLSKTTNSAIIERLVPDVIVWSKELVPLLIRTPNPSLALMRPFAGSAFLALQSEKDISKEVLYALGLVHEAPRGTDLQTGTWMRDRLDFSRPLRMAMFTVGLFSNIEFLKLLPIWQQVTMIRLVAVTHELVNDQLDLNEENKLFGSNQDPEALELVRNFVSDCKQLLNCIALQAPGWQWQDGPSPVAQRTSTEETSSRQNMSMVVHALVNNLVEATSYIKPRIYGYYASRALARLLEALSAAQPWKSEGGEQWLFALGFLKTTSTDSLAAQSVLIGIDSVLVESKITNTFCNHLISDLVDAKPNTISTLEKVILLNACLEIYKTHIPVAKNRIMFAMKNMVSWFPKLASQSKALSSEVCRALQLLLPATKDVYGPQWGSTIEFCISIWELEYQGSLSDENIPMVGMSLKLYSVLSKMEEPNDDLQAALEEHADAIIHGLLQLLKLRRTKLTVPLKYIDDLLSRIFKSITPRPLSELSDTYPLVASDFPAVQTAAYGLLSSALSEAQQQISVDVLLEKKDAQLPDELLSLLLEVPSVHSFSELEISEFPPAFRSYLFTWHLIFQSFATASHKVRNDYTEVLKSGKYIEPLLSFIADVLGHSVGNPLDLATAGIDSDKRRNYDITQASENESSEKNMHWLLSNVYCLALIYTPTLVKVWWTSCESRATKIAYDGWTEKFFTQIVVAEHLEEVQKWADNQEVADDEKELIVKTSTRSRDIFAGYEIDEMMMQINIQLPANYPLHPVEVTSVNRVGISETKWKSFMITTQAVISFSNGSITEGLSTFRRNITFALKGHTECAICYSVISSDKKTPDKKCSTCNNLFHSKCLYTWFMSSSQSTCPLCRNPFNYGAR